MLRARDSKAAASLWSEINAMTPGSVDKPADVPDVACTEKQHPKPPGYSSAWDASDRFMCTLRYDRYVARVASSQLTDAHQRAAAQYALLANSQ